MLQVIKNNWRYGLTGEYKDLSFLAQIKMKQQLRSCWDSFRNRTLDNGLNIEINYFEIFTC